MQNQAYTAIINSPIGKLGIRATPNYLIGLNFLAPQTREIKSSIPLVLQTIKQLQKYFSDPHYVFNLPMQFNVTAFQKRVLAELQKIPVGQVAHYGEIAERANTAPRAIGLACRNNPIAIIIPCHRVVAKNHLGGFSGQLAGRMLDIKKWLLTHEQALKY